MDKYGTTRMTAAELPFQRDRMPSLRASSENIPMTCKNFKDESFAHRCFAQLPRFPQQPQHCTVAVSKNTLGGVKLLIKRNGTRTTKILRVKIKK